MRRVAFGYAKFTLATPVAERLQPLQLGVSVRDGPATFAGVIRAALQEHPDWVTVKLDFRNEVSRLAFLTFVATSFPSILLALLAAYGAPSYLTALTTDGWLRILSQCGATQGCNFGSLAFACALQRPLEQTQQEHPHVLIVALHDDVHIAGPPR